MEYDSMNGQKKVWKYKITILYYSIRINRKITIDSYKRNS